MKKNFFYLTSFLLMLNLAASYSQNAFWDSLQAMPHEHSLKDMFTGNADDSIVCYKSTHRNTFFIITGLIVVLSIVLMKLYFFNKRTNKMLKQQNSLIEEKNKNITDSINYASRLQNAILPSEENIKKILADYFIFYRPKDIVSGDFYWIEESQNKIFITAVDCTGHGVPGALLSMIGHFAIDGSVNENGLTKPSEILLSMNSMVQHVLHQKKEATIQDGMDMALCVIDKNTLQMEYAGANNPLYIISNNELNVLKGSKLTVGTIQNSLSKTPTDYKVQLKKGDCLYLFSDGIVDQFGGANNKKYKSSGLQKLLLSVCDKPMLEQKKIISEAFQIWQGNNEQVDDVLLIGVRV